MFQVNPLLERINMKNQALFSSKDKSKKLKCCLLQFLFGALRINTCLQANTFIILFLIIVWIILSCEKDFY